MNNVASDASCQSLDVPNTFHLVSDADLLFRTRELARHETEITIVTIQHLDEIDCRELYEERGYPSLFAYAVRELNYSNGCAWRRIMVMKLCRAVPGIADKLRSGELNLTTASQLQNAIEKRARKEARKAARKAVRERAGESASVSAAGAVSVGAEEWSAGGVQPAQTEVAGTQEAVPAATEPPPAWTLDQKVELVDLVANKSARETEKLLAELEPELGLPREQQRALGGGRYAVRVILDQGSIDTVAKLKGWLSHVNPGFTTGQLLAYLLQQAERKYDPMRERSRAKRGAAVPARPAVTCEQHLAVTDEHRATGDAVAAVASMAGSSTCATGAPGEEVPATVAARSSVARSSVAAGPVAGSPAGALAAAGPSVARAGSSAPNWQAQAVAAPDSEQVRRDTTSSAQNQQAARVPDRSGDRTPRHAGSVGASLSAAAPAVPSPRVARAGSSAPNQQAARAGNGPSRTDAELHSGVRVRLLGDGAAARPPAPESARARRGRRHIHSGGGGTVGLAATRTRSPASPVGRPTWCRSTTSCRWRRAALTTWSICVCAAPSITDGGTRAVPATAPHRPRSAVGFAPAVPQAIGGHRD